MSFDSWLPLLLIASSLIPGLIIFWLREDWRITRVALNLLGATVKLLLVGVMLWGVYYGHTYQTTIPLLPTLDLTLRVDPLPMLFVTLSAVLWLVTTVYAIGCLEVRQIAAGFLGSSASA